MRSRIPVVVACACLLFLLALPAGAGAAPGHRLVAGGDRAQRHAVQEFWTAERLRAAKPRDRLIGPLGASARAIAARFADSPALAGPLTSVPSHPPLPSSPAARRSGLVPDASVYPYVTNGKLFTKFGRAVYQCSGTLINTKSQRLVVTAGHCVREGYGREGDWADKVVFIPGYDHGRRPFGSWVARSEYALDGWYYSLNDNFDVAVVVLSSNGQGRPGDAVGSRGWLTGASRKQNFVPYGYPAGAARGEELRYCVSGFKGLDSTTFRQPGPPTTRIACDMAAGSSGGGWIVNDDQVNGVISYGYNGDRRFTYGPYFGLAVKRLINQLS